MKKTKITSFNFRTGKIISSKYEIVNHLGSGWEGEVYLVKEIDTDIERAAKFFYPHQNPNNKTVKGYAKKLHKLRACNSLIKYIAKDKLKIKGNDITYLLSDFVEGETLDTYINSYHPNGVPFYQALHLFYAVVKAVEEIHINKEWHGDIHEENIIIQKSSLSYDLKLIDVFQVRNGERGSIYEDVVSLCHLLYIIIGGEKTYKKQPNIIKNICCGLKRTMIKRRFKNATSIRVFMENQVWE